jgi:hypothetical protein
MRGVDVLWVQCIFWALPSDFLSWWCPFLRLTHWTVWQLMVPLCTTQICGGIHSEYLRPEYPLRVFKGQLVWGGVFSEVVLPVTAVWAVNSLFCPQASLGAGIEIFDWTLFSGSFVRFSVLPISTRWLNVLLSSPGCGRSLFLHMSWISLALGPSSTRKKWNFLSIS